MICNDCKKPLGNIDDMQKCWKKNKLTKEEHKKRMKLEEEKSIRFWELVASAMEKV